MLTAIIDYESGNLHSAEKAFQRMAREVDAGDVLVTDAADIVAKADRIVLPGDGAFPACAAALKGHGVFDALREAVETRGRPFMGICVGMQLMAERGLEKAQTPGLGWIKGDIVQIKPNDPAIKIPQIGWNTILPKQDHPILNGIETGPDG
ncbi:MAG: imidazole glycerol phosphate synthase subunit HisH, partial [Pseudomonadota bacterium]